MAKRKNKKQTGLLAVLIALCALVVILVAAIILVAKGVIGLNPSDNKDNAKESASQSEKQEKKEKEKAERSLSVSSDSFDITWGSELTIPVEKTGEGEITFTVSDENFASIDNGVLTPKRVGTVTVTAAFADEPEICATVQVNISPLIEEIDGVTYVNNILIANKSYGLPGDFGGYNDEADAAFDEWADAAAAEGLSIYVSSGYRSYDTQYAIYWREYDEYGFDYVEGSTARPGFSEHQTGLAFDLNSISMDFEDTDEFAWCIQHAHEYGFILRYPEGKTDITGYMYEPWHFRYIGDAAADVYASGLTLEEYLGIDSAYKTNEVYR